MWHLLSDDKYVWFLVVLAFLYATVFVVWYTLYKPASTSTTSFLNNDFMAKLFQEVGVSNGTGLVLLFLPAVSLVVCISIYIVIKRRKGGIPKLPELRKEVLGAEELEKQKLTKAKAEAIEKLKKETYKRELKAFEGSRIRKLRTRGRAMSSPSLSAPAFDGLNLVGSWAQAAERAGVKAVTQMGNALTPAEPEPKEHEK